MEPPSLDRGRGENENTAKTETRGSCPPNHHQRHLGDKKSMAKTPHRSSESHSEGRRVRASAEDTRRNGPKKKLFFFLVVLLLACSCDTKVVNFLPPYNTTFKTLKPRYSRWKGSKEWLGCDKETPTKFYLAFSAYVPVVHEFSNSISTCVYVYVRSLYLAHLSNNT